MSEKNKIKSYAVIFIGIVLFISILDYYVKCSIESTPLYSVIYNIGSFVSIIHVRNYGGAFSILQHKTAFLAAMGLIVPIALFAIMRKLIFADLRYLTACALITGGALGNLIDRLAYGYVVDYIAVGTFPVFNISDSFITVGAFFLAFLVFFNKTEDKTNCGSSEEQCIK